MREPCTKIPIARHKDWLGVLREADPVHHPARYPAQPPLHFVHYCCFAPDAQPILFRKQQVDTAE